MSMKAEELTKLKKEFLEEEGRIIKSVQELGFESSQLIEFMSAEPDYNLDQAEASHFIDLQNQAKQLEKQRLLLFAQELVVDELNKKHAVVHTDRFHILTEKRDPIYGGTDFILESKQSFKDMYENQKVQLPSGKPMSKSKIWLESETRREYEGLIFHPHPEKLEGNYYNIWRGFAIAPKKGSCEKFKQHILNVICKGNPSYFEYVWKWCARLDQMPHLLGEVALALIGEQGTGKNTFVNALGEIFGSHYRPLDNLHQLLGQFNFHLKNAVLIHGNEALWGGNKKDIGKLKALITEKEKNIEAKGKDIITIPNFTHLILSSNEDWAVHLDRDDRRFFVLHVSNEHKEDKAYFKGIHDELNHGGLEAFLFELLQEDISDFNHRQPPYSTEAFEMKLMSGNSCERYIYEALKLGCFDLGNASPAECWQSEKQKNSVYIDYGIWCENEGELKQSNATLGKAFNKLIPSVETIRPRTESRTRCYLFPELNIARKGFEKAYKVSPIVWNL